jgi:hypothetical protein
MNRRFHRYSQIKTFAGWICVPLRNLRSLIGCARDEWIEAFRHFLAAVGLVFRCCGAFFDFTRTAHADRTAGVKKNQWKNRTASRHHCGLRGTFDRLQRGAPPKVRDDNRFDDSMRPGRVKACTQMLAFIVYAS